MKRINWLIICVLANVGFSSNLFSNSDREDFIAIEGFVAGTPVKTPSGYSLIETISPGDIVMSCDFLKARRTVNGDFHADRVAAIANRWAQYFRDRKNSQYASLLNWLIMPANHHSCNMVNGQKGDL